MKDRLRVFENRVLRRTFELKRAEVTGDWKKLHNEELHNLHYWANIIKIDQVKITMDLRETGWGGMDWINLAHDRDQWRTLCEHSTEPLGSIKCWEVV
jgi:hypothetical protein